MHTEYDFTKLITLRKQTKKNRKAKEILSYTTVKYFLSD